MRKIIVMKKIIVIMLLIIVFCVCNRKTKNPLYKFQVSVNDEMIQVPIQYEDLIAADWTYEGDENTVVDASNYLVSDYFTKDNYCIYGFFYNDSTEPAFAKDCYLGSINFNLFTKSESTKVLLPKNIELGVSTLEETLDAYGIKNYFYDGDFPIITYKMSDYRYIKLSFDSGKILRDIYMEYPKDESIYRNKEANSIRREWYFNDTNQIHEYISTYQAPEALSSDPFNYYIEVQGDLYQLPIPVFAFIDNGWRVNDKTIGQTIYLERDNDVELAYLGYNLDHKIVDTEKYFITTLYIDKELYGNNYSIKIMNNITIGMTVEELEKALRKEDYTIKKYNDYVVYLVNDPDLNEEENKISFFDQYQILVSDGKVNSIYIGHVQ